jgi:predicted ester cyclase
MRRKLLSAEIPKKRKAAGDFSVYEELFDDDFVDYTPQPNTTPDTEGVRKLYGCIRAALPDFHGEIHWQLLDGERVTTYKTYYGKHEGPFLGIAPAHRKIHFEQSMSCACLTGRSQTIPVWAISC